MRPADLASGSAANDMSVLLPISLPSGQNGGKHNNIKHIG